VVVDEKHLQKRLQKEKVLKKQMKNSIKIGILSDSHRKPTLTKEALDNLISKDIQYIIHAGDLEIKENLDLLKQTNLPYVCVFGNNDQSLLPLANEYKINNEPYYFKIKDLTFKLMHLPFYLNSDTNIIISGHTHKFEQSYINNTLFLNPGEVCARNKNLSEHIFLEITPNEYIIEYNYKKPSENIWQNKITNYKRVINDK
jgi:putative phosphoesterase